jgi:hypothetical protein
MMRVRRLLTRGPNDEAVRRTIHVRPIDERWKVLYASSNRRCSSDCMSRRPSTISRT